VVKELLKTVLFASLGAVSCCAEPAADEADSHATIVAAQTQTLSQAATRKVLERGLSHVRDDLQMEHQGNGVKRLNYAGRFQHATLIVRDADGKVSQHCVNDASSAKKLLGMDP
jgi:hypothetical protein